MANPSASSIAAIGLALALLGGAGWWFGVQRPTALRRATAQAAAEAAAAEARPARSGTRTCSGNCPDTHDC
jgi:hypothetical protein